MKRFILYNVLLMFVNSAGLFTQDVPKAPDQPSEPTTNIDVQVKINGGVLSDQLITEIEQAYGANPLPGNYWYDTYSGLYGAVGYPSFGFMLAGDEIGELKADASTGICEQAAIATVRMAGLELPVGIHDPAGQILA